MFPQLFLLGRNYWFWFKRCIYFYRITECFGSAARQILTCILGCCVHLGVHNIRQYSYSEFCFESLVNATPVMYSVNTPWMVWPLWGFHVLSEAINRDRFCLFWIFSPFQVPIPCEWLYLVTGKFLLQPTQELEDETPERRWRRSCAEGGFLVGSF